MSYTIYKKVTIHKDLHNDCKALVPVITNINFTLENVALLTEYFKKKKFNYVLVENEYVSLPMLLVEATQWKQEQEAATKTYLEKEEAKFKSLTEKVVTTED